MKKIPLWAQIERGSGDTPDVVLYSLVFCSEVCSVLYFDLLYRSEV